MSDPEVSLLWSVNVDLTVSARNRKEISEQLWDSLGTVFGPFGWSATEAPTVRKAWHTMSESNEHYVTFEADSWQVEHSTACWEETSPAGMCIWTHAVALIAGESDPEMAGRWRITEIDSEGLPILERAPKEDAP